MKQGFQDVHTRNALLGGQVLAFVEAHYRDSQISLSKLLKHATDNHFAKYIESLRIRKAEELIDTGGHSLGEIAGMVGYNSPQVFRRAYKRLHRETPSQRQGR